MYKFLYSLLFSGIFIISSASAQQQTGCLLPAGTLHYQANGTSGGKTNYNTNPNVLLSSVFCVATVVSNPNCRVNKNSGASFQGTKRTFYLVQCPIDDYIPLIILAIGGFGFFSIRKSSLTKNLLWLG